MGHLSRPCQPCEEPSSTHSLYRQHRPDVRTVEVTFKAKTQFCQSSAKEVYALSECTCMTANGPALSKPHGAAGLRYALR